MSISKLVDCPNDRLFADKVSAYTGLFYERFL